jgi:exopolysaccharide production protein ExoQ
VPVPRIFHYFAPLWGSAFVIAALIEQRAVVPISIVLAIAAVITLRREFTQNIQYIASKMFGLPIILMLLLIAWTALSVMWAPEPADSAKSVLKFFGNSLCGLIILATVLTLSPTFAKQLVLGVAIGLGAILAYLALDIATGGAVGLVVFEVNYHAIYGFFWFKPAAALIALVSWPIALLAYKKYGNLGVVIVLCIAAGYCHFIGFKAGPFAIALGGATALICLRLRSVLVPALAACIVTAVMIMPALFQSAASSSQMIERNPGSSLEYSIVHRLLIWEFVADKVTQRPALGWGMNSSSYVGNKDPLIHPERGKIGEAIPSHPHNGALQVWLELGGIGALIFACLWASVLLRINRAILDTHTLALSLGLFTTVMMFWMVNFGIWSSWWQQYIWFAAIMMTSVIRLSISKASAGTTANK